MSFRQKQEVKFLDIQNKIINTNTVLRAFPPYRTPYILPLALTISAFLHTLDTRVNAAYRTRYGMAATSRAL